MHIAFGQTLEFRFGAKSRKSEEIVDFSNKRTIYMGMNENLNWFGDPEEKWGVTEAGRRCFRIPVYDISIRLMVQTKRKDSTPSFKSKFWQWK